MKTKSIFALAAFVALPLIASAAQAVKITFVPQGVFAKSRTITIPLPPQRPQLATYKVGTEQTFYTRTTEEQKDGAIVTTYTAHPVFFGITAKVQCERDCMNIELSEKVLLGFDTSPDESAIAPRTKEWSVSTAVRGRKFDIGGGGSYKHVWVSVL